MVLSTLCALSHLILSDMRSFILSIFVGENIDIHYQKNCGSHIPKKWQCWDRDIFLSDNKGLDHNFCAACLLRWGKSLFNKEKCADELQDELKIGNTMAIRLVNSFFFFFIMILLSKH